MPVRHQRATTRIERDKALWTTALSSPGPLTVLEAAGCKGLWMVCKSWTAAGAHGPRRRARRKEPLAPGHNGWQDAAFCLCARTSSSSLRPFSSSLKPCSAWLVQLLVVNPFLSSPNTCGLQQASRVQGKRYCTNLACEYCTSGEGLGSFLRWTQTAKVSAQNKKKQPHSSPTIKLECKEDQALAVTASLAKSEKNPSSVTGQNYHQLVQCFLPGSRRTQMSTSSSVKISSFRTTLLLWTQPPLLLLQVYLSPCIHQCLWGCATLLHGLPGSVDLWFTGDCKGISAA